MKKIYKSLSVLFISILCVFGAAKIANATNLNFANPFSSVLLPNDATKYLDGTGNFSTPAGGGGGGITLTTTGTSGAATLTSGTLNIPVYANTTYTASTGLTLTGTAFSVNTSQNIATLSNLTSNGLIKTSGGAGTLSTATAGTDYIVPTSAFTAGSIAFADGSGQLNQNNANLFWDNTNNRLGIGTAVPTDAFTMAAGKVGDFYNTTDQTTNYERAKLDWSSNVFQIQTQAGGTGTSRAISIFGQGDILNIAGDASGAGIAVRRDSTGLGQLFAVTSAGLTSSSAIQSAIAIEPTITQTSSAGYNGLFISPFENTTGSGNKYLINAGTNTAANGGGTHTAKFTVDDTGAVVGASFNGVALTTGGSSSNCLTGAGTYSACSSGSGTVTSASVVTANGFAGTVATATTTPAITITTNVTGVLKGNGTAISAATAGTDYIVPTSSFTTGSVAFGGSSGQLNQNNADLFWDNSNNRLGLFTTAPTHTVTLASTSTGIAAYNTVDQTTNLEKAVAQWQSNAYTLGVYSAGTGVVRSLQLGVANAIGTNTFTAGARVLAINASSSGNIGLFDFSTPTTGNASFLSLGGGFSSSSAMQNGFSIQPTVLQTSTAGYRALFISPFESTIGSGNKYLIDAGTNSAASGGGTHTSQFLVNDTGSIIGSTSSRLNLGTLPGAGKIVIGSDGLSTASPFSTSGFAFQSSAATYTTTAATSSPALVGINTFGIPTLVATNSQAITNAATLYIAGVPVASTNVTITNPYALYINAGNILFNNGNLTLGTAGNKINIATGSNASVGTATLSGGTVTVSTTAVTASSKIFLTDATTGSLTNIGTPTVGTITAGTSFVINSSNVLDASNINWFIIN